MLQLYKSRQYLQKLLLSFMVCSTIIIAISSWIFYFYSQNQVLRTQYDADQKLLTQINFNIQNKNDIIRNLAISIYYDNDLIALKSGTELDQILLKTEKLNYLVTLSPFLQSIVFYNGKMDGLYGSTNHDVNNEQMLQDMRKMLKGSNEIPKLKLIPTKFSSTGGEEKLDVFSFVMYNGDSINSYDRSALVLNVKPTWLLDNLKVLNQLMERPNNEIIVIDSDGNTLIDNERTISEPDAMKQDILQHIAASKQTIDHFSYSFLGRKYMITFMREVNGWQLISIQSYNEIMGNLIPIKITAITLSLLLILISILLSFLVSHKLYKPIEQLLMQVNQEQTKNSNFGSSLSLPMKDELSYISNVYSKLHEKIKGVQDIQDQHDKIAKMYYMRSLIVDSRSFTADEFSQCISQQKLNVNNQGDYVLAVVKIDNYKEINQNTNSMNVNLLNFAVTNIIEEILLLHFACESVDMKSDHLVFLISMQTEFQYEELRAAFQEIQSVVANYYKITCTVAIGGQFSHYQEITENYSRTLRYSNYRLLFGKQAIIVPAMVSENEKNQELPNTQEQEKNITEGLKSNNWKRLEDGINKWMAHISRFNYDHMYSALLHLVVILTNTLGEMNRHKLNPVVVDMKDVNQQIFEKETLAEIRKVFMDICHEIVEKQQDRSEDKSKILVDTIKEMIHKNYMDHDLNVQKIAQMLKMSHDYLGQVYKEIEAVSIIDKINDVRLYHAKEMLEHYDLNVNEIMDKVGFSNASYFYRLFKKKFGTPPKEYRLKKMIES